jgi:hypothetical protein
MEGLLLIIVFGLALLSFTAVTAGNTNVAVEGYNWAPRICSSASAFLVRTAGLEPAQGFLPEGF